MTCLQTALLNTATTIIYADLDARIKWAENVPASWSTASIEGRRLSDVLPTNAAGVLAKAGKKVRTDTDTQQLIVSLPGVAGVTWFLIWVDCDRARDGSPIGTITTAVDITEKKRSEQTLRLLLLEVAHRSKNLLAIIQSVATQTGRHSLSIQAFLKGFQGRLQSLAATQDLVTASNWRGANLHDLVLGQVARYVDSPTKTVHFTGETPYLNPNAALHIGLALHELASNSARFGALSGPKGNVQLAVTRGDGTEANALILEWSEAIDPTGKLAGSKRFGSVALERVVPSSLTGSALLDIGRDKVTYRLTIPAGNFESV